MPKTIKPFRNNSAFPAWRGNNCARCKFGHIGNSHASVDTIVEQVESGTECPLKAALQIACAVGSLAEIKLSTAKQIGYHNLYGFPTKCKAQRRRKASQGHTGDNPGKPVKEKSEANQLNLF